MNLLQTISLVVHVISGVVGVIAAYAILIEILRRQPEIKKILTRSILSLVGYLLSWVSGGYYYLTYYGSKVKPVILAGQYPWAHQFMTELKEHMFLFLPFLALAATLTIWLMGERLHNHPKLKTSTAMLVGVVVTLGSLMALMGVAISGAVR